MWQDFRLGLRSLLKSPGFACTALLSLAIGIGANTAVFSLVNELLLRTLPVRDPAQLVIFRNIQGAKGGMARSTDGYGSRDPATGRHTTTSFPLSTIDAFAARADVLSRAFGFSPFWQCNVLVNGQPDLAATAQMASGGYHEGLGVSAWLGRTFTADDDQPGAEPVAVISHRFWQRNFGGNADVIGRTFQLNKVTVTIIGVTPEAFAGAGQAGEYYDVTVPLAQHGRFAPDMAEERRRNSTWWVRVMGRLAPGVSAEQAQAALAPVFTGIARDGWQSAPRRGTEQMPDDPLLRAESGARGENDNRREFTRGLQMMLGLVVLVLIAACANVANLLLARATARRREIALRLALGATRGRIIRQLLLESLLLAAAAAALGTLFAWWARGALIALRPFGNGVDLSLPLDARVLGFTLAAAAVTAVAFGLAPALRATRLDLAHEFSGGRTTHGTRSWLSRGLMVLQIAMSLLLLVCTGLMIGSLRNLQRVDAGFNRHSLAAFRIDPASAGYSGADGMALRARLQQRLAALPGVSGVTYARMPVLSRSRQTSSVTLVGETSAGQGQSANVHVNAVAPDFFAVAQLPVLLGRAFTEGDAPGAPRVAIVNQAFAKRYLSGANPVGQRFRYGPETGDIEIVGLARDAKYADLRSEVPPTVYFPALQHPGGPANFLVRASGDPAALFSAIRSAVREIDPALPVLNLRTMDEQVNRLHNQELLVARLGGIFGILVLLLSAVGLYGLMAYAVARRTGEIGVRMALGALPGHVLRQFLGESLALVVIGLVFGGFAAWGVAQLLTRMLFGLGAADPLTYGLAAAVLLLVGLAAAALPAWRAARIDPTVALRTE